MSNLIERLRSSTLVDNVEAADKKAHGPNRDENSITACVRFFRDIEK